MENSPPPIDADVASTGNPNCGRSLLTVEKHDKKPNSHSNVTVSKKQTKNKKKKKDVQKPHIEVSSDHQPQQSLNSVSSSSSSTSNLPHSRAKGFRLYGNRKNPRVFNGPVSRKKNVSEADSLALPLGMSIAAFVAQVLEKKDANGEKMPVDHLSEICTLAVKESLSNLFGDKFDCFVSNFERSFQSTLMTLRVINESSENRARSYLHMEDSSNDFRFYTKEDTSTSQEQANIVGLDEENNMHRDPIYNGLAVFQDSRNDQRLACVPPYQLHSRVNQSSMLTTFERSVSEQARSNDLKALEISLSMKKMRLKEAQIAVSCDSNILKRSKLSMGIFKANFRTEKFKTELEDARHAELLGKCADCLIAGLLIMLFCLAYGIYTHSHQRLIEATESCMPIKESSSWWVPKPMASFSSGLQILRCQVQVLSQMLFGVLMIIAITYLLIQRMGTTNKTMPITFIILLLGVGCGFAGKFCIDTLGGSGIYWLSFWELLCLVHFFANFFTSMLFVILYGPVTVVDHSMSHKLFPYWFRRVVFYSIVLVYLPLLCGLMPFAGPREWLEHFASLVVHDVSD